MKRILAVLAIGMAAAWADESGGRPVIEKANNSLTASLDAVDLRRMAAGMPPRVRSILSLSAEPWSGWFTYVCRTCNATSRHRNLPRLRVVTGCQTPFTAAEVIEPIEPQGARFVRGADGAIVQFATSKDCYFISTAKSAIIAERYHTPDCRTEADGLMKPLPDADCQARFEIRDLTNGPGKDVRKFEITGRDKAGEFLMTMEHTERKGQAQILSLMYRGHEAKPESLISRGFLQRIFWPEGPGYRQIRKEERAGPDGELKVGEHVIENWRVAADGSRKLAEKQELVAPEKTEEAEPSDEPDEFH